MEESAGGGGGAPIKTVTMKQTCLSFGAAKKSPKKVPGGDAAAVDKKSEGAVPGTVFGKALYGDMAAWKAANPGEKLRVYSWNVNGIKSTLKKNDL